MEHAMLSFAMLSFAAVIFCCTRIEPSSTYFDCRKNKLHPLAAHGWTYTSGENYSPGWDKFCELKFYCDDSSLPGNEREKNVMTS